MVSEPGILRFGAFVVDTGDRRLNGPDGPIHLGGRAFGVLLALLQANGRLVSKDKLFETVWEGLAVSDAALTSVIRELRIALNDAGKDGMIKTVYGTGYRLEASSATKSVHAAPMASAMSASNDPPKVAVLPFDDLSPDSNVGYFSDGVSEEILATLSRGSDIRTIGKLSSFQFRGPDKARAGRELAATHVLDGSVRRAGDRVRITAHLYDTQSGETVWSESFEGALGELIDTQMTIAEAIAGELRQRFTSRPSQVISPESYDLFLKAKSVEFDYAQQSAALGMLERITRDAPNFAPAWGLMAGTLAALRMTRPLVEWPALIEQARDAISRARSLDPLEPSALTAELKLSSPYGEYELREDLLARMQPVMGNTAAYHFLQAWCLGSVGRLSDAISEAKLSRELDPMMRSGEDYYGYSLYHGGRLAEARAALLEELKLAPENHRTAITLLLCAGLLGDRALVDQLLDPERLARFPLGDNVKLLPIVRIELTGDVSLACSVATALRQKVLARGCFDTLSAGYIARYKTPADCHDLIADLPYGPTGEDASDFFSINTLYLLLPDWPDIRRDRRFAVLCARLGLAQFWTDRDVWPDCADESGLEYDFRSAMREAAESITAEPPLFTANPVR